MNDEEFVDYIKKNGWIKPLDSLTINKLFNLLHQVLACIETKIMEINEK